MQENYLAKWLSGELSEQELREFETSEAYASFQKLKEASSGLQAPDFDVDQALLRFKEEHMAKSPKVITLNPFRKFLKVAAVIAIPVSYTHLTLPTNREV